MHNLTEEEIPSSLVVCLTRAKNLRTVVDFEDGHSYIVCVQKPLNKLRSNEKVISKEEILAEVQSRPNINGILVLDTKFIPIHVYKK